MWRMPIGNRVLTEAEWALFRVGLGTLWDFVEDDSEGDVGLSETGVHVFDVLQPEQKIGLLADVGQALRDPAIPAPRHHAANEGAIAAVFATIRQAVEEEIEFAPVEGGASTEIRSLLLAAVADAEDQPEDLPAHDARDSEAWEWVLQAIEDRIFWDADYEVGDEFLDLPPESAHELLARMTIDPEYYTTNPREPNEAGLIAARQTLARLLGRPVPDDEGLYPTLADLYHDLTVGPCSPEVIGAWSDHPWIEVRQYTEPEWDCDYTTWTAEFRVAVPAEPFSMAPQDSSGSGLAPESEAWPEDLRVECHGKGWVIRDESGDCWCDALTNCWSRNPGDEEPVLTFSSPTQARTAYLQAARMYRERSSRHAAALSRLGRSESDEE